MGRRPYRFVIGAYSAMSLRSDPSPANRTTTMPPGSTPVTTPSPNAAWTTSSPIRRSVPVARVGHVEHPHGPRDADVTEATLLLEVALVERARVGEHPLLAADHEDDG